MDFNDYQDKAMKTAVYKDALKGTKEAISYCLLKLASEVGEAAGAYAKHEYRKDEKYTEEEAKENLAKEIGDVLWYIAATASEIGYTLEDVAEMNIKKLSLRSDNNTIKGDGDNR